MSEPYDVIENADALKAHIAKSNPVWLFKHSDACGTSFYAIGEFKQYLEQHPDDDAAIIVIQSHRELSNMTADLLSVIHKSPQLFLVQDGKVLWQTSLMGITVKAMEQAKQAV